jgi:large subunit ribosomal protein L31
MKKDIHPDLNLVIFRDVGAKKDFVMYSTLTSEETEKVKGEEAHVIRLDVSSASHPFYTGKQNLMDRSGRVEKFKAKQAKAQQAAA